MTSPTDPTSWWMRSSRPWTGCTGWIPPAMTRLFWTGALTDAFQRLDVMAGFYLGPAEDIAGLRNEFVKWNTIREETIRRLHQGKVQEAADRTKPAGIGGAQARKIYLFTATVNAFARNEADKLFKDASERKTRLDQRFYLYVTACLLFTLIISIFLVKWIRMPLTQIANAADRVREGDFAVRCSIDSTNEFGTVGAAFDDMAQTLQVEMEINDHTASLVGILFTETDAKTFCRKLLSQLMNHTGSQIGAVYLLTADQAAFEMFESIGLTAGGRTAFSKDTLEGEFGSALASGQVQHITAIPDDTCLTFSAVTGEFRPREIITIPVLAEETPVAVISLAGIRPYEHKALRLITDVLPIITARLNGMLLYRQIQELADRLETQTSELTEMNAELETQSRELEHASRLKSIFLANMSHELRTPLNSVIALSGVLARRLGSTIPEEEHGYLEIIERNEKHLLSLINDILDLSRIEAGREEITPDTFAIRKLTDTVVEMLDPLAQEKNIDLINRVEADLPPLFSDPEKVRHILQNLAGNAVKFTQTGSVEITARHQNDGLDICVIDSGIGISNSELACIFDEFHQVDDSTSRPYAGTGLGLAIARKYARMLGGDIFVESTPKQGSTFTLRLPLRLSLPKKEAADAYPKPPRPAAQPSGQTGPAGHRILLVEDSEAIVIQMTEMLAEQGYDIRTAKNGIEALARIQEEVPDAVILDLMMPEMDGFAVLKEIRGTARTEKLPVLILAARQVTREELGFLRHNHIYQLIRKGDIRRKDLLASVAGMVAPPADANPGKRPPIRRRTVSGKPKILVVEDNPDNLRTLQALLQETCTVVEARNGKAGVAQARQDRPDLILMDLALPVMDGYAALAAIREDEDLRDIPVVAVTASAMKGDQETILSRGFDGYVSKPIDAQMLKTTIEKVLYGNQ